MTQERGYLTLLDNLDIGFVASERGNILLVHNEEKWINAWVHLSAGKWLEIAFRDCNYPALHVAAIEVSDSDLANHIRKEFADGLWSVNKCCIDGVVDSSNEVIPLEQADEDS